MEAQKISPVSALTPVRTSRVRLIPQLRKGAWLPRSFTLSTKNSQQSGVGSVNGNPMFAANNMSVDFTGVTDAQTITVKLSQVTDTAFNVFSESLVSMRVLVGDTSGNGSVTSTDVSQTKLQSGQAVTAANFREDIIPTGQINGSDVSQAKLRVGSGVP